MKSTQEKTEFAVQELTKNRYLADNLIIEDWQVVKVIKIKDKGFENPVCLPFFDIESFPFVIVN